MSDQAFIGTVHPPSTSLLSGNLRYEGLEWQPNYIPEYRVYIYNVSAREFKGVGHFRLTIPGVNENDSVEVGLGDPKELGPNSRLWKIVDPETGRPMKIRAGKQNEKWHICTSFPQPLRLAKGNDNSGRLEALPQDAIRVVVDMINPDNLSQTLDTVISPEHTFSQGNDLSQKGVFFSLSYPPFEKDVKAAFARMEKYYQALLNEANTLDLVDKKLLSEKLVGNPDYAYAAEYFGQVTTWNRTPQRVEECNNCGEKKPAGRKFHNSSFGLCVERSREAWDAVVEAGLRTPEQIPEKFRDVKKEKRPE